MLAVERPPQPLGGGGGGGAGLDMTSRSVKGHIQDFMHSGNFNATPEVNSHLKHIGTGVDHIRLDNDFLRSSRGWAARFDPETTSAEQRGAQAAMGRTAGVIHNTKTQNNTRTLKEMMDNEVRQNHHRTVNNLRNTQNDLAPYAHQAVDRVHQYCDFMGVTDRYTGYRHNLNRGNRDPVRLGYSWVDANKNPQNTSKNVSWRSMAASAPSMRKSPTHLGQPSYGYNRVTRPETAGNINEAQLFRSRGHRPPITASIQEQCGINTTFPGKTEYMVRYAQPEKSPSVGFKINPQPDMSTLGRPLCKQAFYPKASEYQTRYEWPNGSKIDKLPWLRK